MFAVRSGRLVPTSSFHYAVEDADSVLEIVQLSIKKWDAIVEHIEQTGDVIADSGSVTCACCEKLSHCFCRDCPLGEDMGDPERDMYDHWFREPSLESARRMRTALVVQAMKLQND